MSRSLSYKHYTFDDIEWLVLPAASLGHFYIAEAARKEDGFRGSIAVVTWAFVLDEVGRRLAGQSGGRFRLHPDE